MEWIAFTCLTILLGMKHGMDGDHVAAIADMVGSAGQKRKQVLLGVMYAFGHGFIVFLIGLLSLFLGVELSKASREALELLVSLSLLALGTYMLITMVWQRQDYVYKSRLRIVYELFARSKRNNGVSTTQFGMIGAFIIGIIHGIGVESPTQIVILSNAVGVHHISSAMMQLILFVVGLLISTITIALCFSWGFMKTLARQRLYFILGSVTGIYSIGLGVSMLLAYWKGGA